MILQKLKTFEGKNIYLILSINCDNIFCIFTVLKMIVMPTCFLAFLQQLKNNSPDSFFLSTLCEVVIGADSNDVIVETDVVDVVVVGKTDEDEKSLVSNQLRMISLL